MNTTLRLLTINMWGLGYGLAKDRPARFRDLSHVLPSLAPDVIAVQEAWMATDRQTLIANAQKAGLAYYVHYQAGIVGTGLLLLSRYPIIETRFWRFRLNGYPQHFVQGDYFAGKGIGLARVQTPAGELDVYNMHLVAQYKPDFADYNLTHRMTSVYEAAGFMNAHSHSHPVVLMGDYNIQPYQPAYHMLLRLTGLQDSYAQVHPDSPGYTITSENLYTKSSEKTARLDYICLRGTSNSSLHPESSDIVLQRRACGKPYSDHYGVLSVVQLTPEPTQDAQRADISKALQHLASVHSLLSIELYEAQKQQRQALRAGLTASIIALLLLGRPPTRIASIVIWPLVWLRFWFMVVHLPEERHALHALRAEIGLQIENVRARQAHATETT
ncbi:MAG: endonuclease/exonuclease/phosphatase family protein [Anaerolineales bacterium]